MLAGDCTLSNGARPWCGPMHGLGRVCGVCERANKAHVSARCREQTTITRRTAGMSVVTIVDWYIFSLFNTYSSSHLPLSASLPTLHSYPILLILCCNSYFTNIFNGIFRFDLIHSVVNECSLWDCWVCIAGVYGGAHTYMFGCVRDSVWSHKIVSYCWNTIVVCITDLRLCSCVASDKCVELKLRFKYGILIFLKIQLRKSWVKLI
jgi:hypothetical protein